MSLEVFSVSKLYGSQKALDEVSFSVSAGEVVGFLGPNGAGKSTLMKILTCYIPQSSGKAKVCGYSVEEEPLQVKASVGYLPEHNPLYLEMYVKEYLEFISGLHAIKSPAKRIAEMIHLTGLEAEKNKKIGALSKGYRQRVGLAQAIIHDPKVLILDEPTSGLDPNQLAEIRKVILEIGKEKTVLLSTHIMQEVEAMCRRVIIIRKGKIVADKPTSELISGTGNQTVITIEFDREVNRGLLKNMAGVIEANPAGGFTWEIIASEKADVRAALFQFAVKNNLQVLTIQKSEQKLEDIFKQLTR